MFGDSSPKDLAAKNEVFESALRAQSLTQNLNPNVKQKVEAGLPQAFANRYTSQPMELLLLTMLSQNQLLTSQGHQPYITT
jgi:hypothetical protein